jgi:hypothetical protein
MSKSMCSNQVTLPVLFPGMACSCNPCASQQAEPSLSSHLAGWAWGAALCIWMHETDIGAMELVGSIR